MHEEERLWSSGYSAVRGYRRSRQRADRRPVVAGAAIFSGAIKGPWTRLVRDSKGLTPSQRETVLPRLVEAAAAISTGSTSAAEIDRLGIAPAVRLAMVRALDNLSVPPDFLLLDAFPLPESDLPQKAIVKGDTLCTSIAAASIAAKVERDRVMCELDREYPGYGFARHKGYCTPAHVAALQSLGPSEVHRISFAPVRDRAKAEGVFSDRLTPRLLV